MFSVHRICSYSLILVLYICTWSSHTDADNLPTCLPTDFHYEYTECDSKGGRWRVSVPAPGKCIGGAPNAPIRGKDCSFTCPAGQYLDINGDQNCHPCPAGTYSLGGGLRIEDWEKIPTGFEAMAEGFSSSALPTYFGGDDSDSASPPQNCTGTGWIPRGEFLSATNTDCTSVLTYSAKLVKAGTVTFTYQYSDDNSAVFHFEVQNDKCQSVNSKGTNKWPSATGEGEWKTITVDLKSGINVMYWKTIPITDEKSTFKPVLIRGIEISGVAFTSECTKCRNGTYSSDGAKFCTLCPKNTYSPRGAATCVGCDNTKEYAEGGSTKCKKRGACKSTDYFEISSPCDAKNQSETSYKWIEPIICRTDLPGAMQLPAASKEKCPPCNPGMQYSNGTCAICPKNHFSDGSGCKPCAVSTAAEYGILYKWWNLHALPPNITTTCLSMSKRGCATKTGWIPKGDHIYSGVGHADDAYLVLGLRVGGFRGSEGSYQGKAAKVSTISFVFETQCTGSCEFYFMQQSKSHGTSVINTWKGNQGKQLFSFKITKNEPIVFSWAFQRADFESAFKDSAEGGGKKYAGDFAKIYSINVTNTAEGGASSCKLCPQGTKQDGCIPCPEGQYIDRNTTRCRPCPENTIVHGDRPWGVESCQTCGLGLHASENHGVCYSTCHYTSPDGHEYDFSKLNQYETATGVRLFTSSGTQYYHHFNISLCGQHGIGKALCRNNLTLAGDAVDFRETKVKSLICRSTIIPSSKPGESPLAAQPVSLGDLLVSITSNATAEQIKLLSDQGYDMKDGAMDVHFNYASSAPTTACPKGRFTTITMRCDPNEKGSGDLQLPPKCPDGTCDGCHFNFMWMTRYACPVCRDSDYQTVKGECIKGMQEIHMIPPKHCLLLDDSKPKIRTQKCLMKVLEILPGWILGLIFVAACVAILMCVTLVYCWKRNRGLEYKYMKLVEGSGNDGELPAAETCALDEEEDDEQFDSVKFKESRGKNFFSKLKGLAKKSDRAYLDGEDDNPFESIQLTDKRHL